MGPATPPSPSCPPSSRNFGATAVQTLGLQLTTATHAAFLIQLTSLFTPVMASVAGERPSRTVWFACVVALAGCLLIAADKVATDADDGSFLAFGARGARARSSASTG